jgi:hypothetical protein
MGGMRQNVSAALPKAAMSHREGRHTAGDKLMKAKIALALAVTAVLSAPAFAAPPKHRAMTERDPMAPYAQATPGAVYQPYAGRPSDVVTFGNRVVGEDPDPNIRAQLLHDPVMSEY